MLPLLQVPIKLSFLIVEKIYDTEGAFFEVPAHCKYQKPIFFARFKTEPKAQ